MAGADSDDSEVERLGGNEHDSGDSTTGTEQTGFQESSRTQEPRTQETPRARGAGFTSGAILLFLSALALIIVTVQNTENVEFEFLWVDVSTPLVVVIMVAIAATIVIDEVVGFFWRRRRRIRRQERDELRRLRKQR
jgi:uncharacterized integral membrane protein